MNLSYLFIFFKEHKKSLAFAVFLMLGESLVSLSVPWVAGIFSASILQDASNFDLSYFQIAALWLSLFVMQAWLRFLSTYRTSLIGANVLTQLSCRLYDHIQVLPVKYFNTRRKGEILSMLSNDVAIISYFISGVLTGLIPSLLILAGAIIIMSTINMTITLLIVVMVPAFFIVLKVIGRQLRPLSQKIVQGQADSVAIASENFGVIKLVKAFTRERLESTRFRNKADEIQALRRQQLKIQSILSPLIQLLVSTGVLIVVIVSAAYYRSGELSITDIVTLLMYGMLFARPMSGLANLYGQVQQALGASTRIIDVFNASPEPLAASSLQKIAIRGEIYFGNVSFGYTAGTNVLNNVSFKIRARETVVILGANGEGKSTILHLLMRFIKPGNGQIILDGYPLESFDLSSLRAQIGLVSQDIALCSGTITDNIAYGYPQASTADIENAAVKAGAHAFISKLELGYDTYVGENGVLLSGGQRQRIALARVLLSEPAILLLDEPTSMFDNAGKEEFEFNFKTLFSKQTVLIVTHDAAVARQGDRVLIMENGAVSERSGKFRDNAKSG